MYILDGKSFKYSPYGFIGDEKSFKYSLTPHMDI
jgi:hypothetical protein